MSSFDQWAAGLYAVYVILRARFPEMPTDEVLKLASDFVKAVLGAHQ